MSDPLSLFGQRSGLGVFQIKDGKHTFEVMLSIPHFKPAEVEVKVVDNFVVIHCKHEEKSDKQGLIQREFTRRYPLPESTEAETVKSSWCPHGILKIEVPKKVTPGPLNEHSLPANAIINIIKAKIFLFELKSRL